MKIDRLIVNCASALFLVVVIACESSNIRNRISEKSAVYSSLQSWEQKKISKGVVDSGFTSDMVYMALGNPSKIESTATSKGNAEVWTYNNYYPSVDAAHMHFTSYTTELPDQPSHTVVVNGRDVPRGFGQVSSFTTSVPQGGSLEPADLRMFTLKILFLNGKVYRLGITPA